MSDDSKVATPEQDPQESSDRAKAFLRLERALGLTEADARRWEREVREVRGAED